MPEPLVLRCRECGAPEPDGLNRAGQRTGVRGIRANLNTSGMPAHVDLGELDRVLASSPVLVLADFWAVGLPRAEQFAPTLELFGREEAEGMLMLKLDTEVHPGAADRVGLQAIPTLVAFRGGRAVERVSGALTLAELRRFAAGALVKVGW